MLIKRQLLSYLDEVYQLTTKVVAQEKGYKSARGW
jgi:hypothetical protein